jgi:hypothetical protein
MMARVLLALALAGFFVATASAEDIYKWVDAQGRLHFSSQPPKGVKAQKMVPRATKPAAAPAATWRQRLEQSNLRRLQTQQQERQDAKKQQQRTQRCLAARRALEILNRDQRLYRVNDQGEREYLNDEQRQSAKAATNQEVATYCQ